MNGHVLEGTSIAVDFWKPSQKRYFHFLSHMHEDHIVGLKASFRGLIYTSKFNAVMLMGMKVKRKCVKVLSLDEPHSLYDEDTDSYFMVTLIDANHCPGSVMFLFQGVFGNILYTADFRCDQDVLCNPILEKAVAENNGFDTLYLDNTYAAEHCEFPTRAEVLEQVIDLIGEHPEHRILIGMHSLGKEEVLQSIALEFNEPILVSKERKVILDMLETKEGAFLTNADCRIEVVNISLLTNRSVHQRRERDGPVLILALTALYEASQRDGTPPRRSGRMDGVTTLPYSDHSPHSELKAFVSKMRPKKILPIVVPNKKRVHNHQFDVSANCVIPPSIMMLENSGSQELSLDLPPACNTENHVEQAGGRVTVMPAVFDSVSATISISLELPLLEPSTNAMKEKRRGNCSLGRRETKKDEKEQIVSHKSSSMSLFLPNNDYECGVDEKHKNITANAQTDFNTVTASDSATTGARHCIVTTARGILSLESSETEKRIDSEELCWGTALTNTQQNVHFDTDVKHDKVIVGCDTDGVKNSLGADGTPCLDLSQAENRNDSEELCWGTALPNTQHTFDTVTNQNKVMVDGSKHLKICISACDTRSSDSSETENKIDSEELCCGTALPNSEHTIPFDTVTNQNEVMVDDCVSKHLKTCISACDSDLSETENKINSKELCWGAALPNIECHVFLDTDANQEEMASVLSKNLKPIASLRNTPCSDSFQMEKRADPEDLCCGPALPNTGAAQNNSFTTLEPAVIPSALDLNPKLFFWSHINARELFASSTFQRL